MMTDAVRNLLAIGAGLLLFFWVATGIARTRIGKKKGPPDGEG